jgi:hypothetical protein
MKTTRVAAGMLALVILFGAAQPAHAGGFVDWLASYLLGKAADAIFDPLTGRPDTRELDRRLAEAERRGAQQDAKVDDIIREFRRGTSPTMTKDEFRALVKQTIGDVSERLARVEKRLNNQDTRLNNQGARISRIEDAVFGPQGSLQRANSQVQRQSPTTQQVTGDDPEQLASSFVARRKGLLNIADPEAAAGSRTSGQTNTLGSPAKSRGTGTYFKGTVTRVYANVGQLNIGTRDGLRTGDRVLLLPEGSRSGATELKIISTLDGEACGRCDAGQLKVGDTVVFLQE